MNKLKSLFAFYALALETLKSDSNKPEIAETREPEPDDKLKPYLPEGAAEFFFDIEGRTCYRDEPGIVFKCIARNFKNANRKFNNWKNEHL